MLRGGASVCTERKSRHGADDRQRGNAHRDRICSTVQCLRHFRPVCLFAGCEWLVCWPLVGWEGAPWAVAQDLGSVGVHRNIVVLLSGRERPPNAERTWWPCVCVRVRACVRVCVCVLLGRLRGRPAGGRRWAVGYACMTAPCFHFTLAPEPVAGQLLDVPSSSRERRTSSVCACVILASCVHGSPSRTSSRGCRKEGGAGPSLTCGACSPTILACGAGCVSLRRRHLLDAARRARCALVLVSTLVWASIVLPVV